MHVPLVELAAMQLSVHTGSGWQAISESKARRRCKLMKCDVCMSILLLVDD